MNRNQTHLFLLRDESLIQTKFFGVQSGGLKLSQIISDDLIELRKLNLTKVCCNLEHLIFLFELQNFVVFVFDLIAQTESEYNPILISKIIL